MNQLLEAENTYKKQFIEYVNNVIHLLKLVTTCSNNQSEIISEIQEEIMTVVVEIFTRFN